MATEWLKWTKGFAKKPEVLRLAGIFKRPRREVAGILMEFFEWADDNGLFVEGTEDVRVGLSGKEFTVLDDVVGVSGFARAMIEVGWLSCVPLAEGHSPDGWIVLPNFARHNHYLGKERALATARQHSRRTRGKQGKGAVHPVTEMSRSDRDKSVTRGEERRGDKRGEEALPPAPEEILPGNPDVGGLVKAWLERATGPRVNRDPTEVREIFIGLTHQGVTGDEIMAEIRDPARNTQEFARSLADRLGGKLRANGQESPTERVKKFREKYA